MTESSPVAATSTIALLAQLIASPSENPPGDERAVADVVGRHLGVDGFSVERFEAAPRRINVVGRLRRGDGARLVLQSHLDTKPAYPSGLESGWNTDPFTATVRDGRLHGLGACDVKGGLATQLRAARTLAHRDDWTGELVVIASADEEDGSTHGAAHLLDLGLLAADAAVVAEPTGARPSYAQLGNAWATVTVTGRASHAGDPDITADAVQGARRFLAHLEEMLADAPEDPRFPGHPRVNVGELSAPGHPGTVPGWCRMRCDIRVLPGQAHCDVWRLYERAAASCRATSVRAGSNCEVTLAPYGGGGCESHLAPSNAAVTAAFRGAFEGEVCAFHGGSDARFFAHAGTPAVVFGPGHLAQAHAPNEYVNVEELTRAEEALVAVALEVLGRPR